MVCSVDNPSKIVHVILLFEHFLLQTEKPEGKAANITDNTQRKELFITRDIKQFRRKKKRFNNLK